jgi:hypothetical protein
MMKGKNLSNAFWAEAINTAVYLKNRSPTRCLDNVTPFEALYGSKPVVNNLKVFGCKDFAHYPKENRRKLDAKSIKCIFIGYCSEFKATQIVGTLGAFATVNQYSVGTLKYQLK